MSTTHNVHAFTEGVSPEDRAMLTRAFFHGLDILGMDGACERQQVKLVHSLVELVRGGERDEQRLCSLAVVRVLARPPASASAVREAQLG